MSFTCSCCVAFGFQAPIDFLRLPLLDRTLFFCSKAIYFPSLDSITAHLPRKCISGGMTLICSLGSEYVKSWWWWWESWNMSTWLIKLHLKKILYVYEENHFCRWGFDQILKAHYSILRRTGNSIRMHVNMEQMLNLLISVVCTVTFRPSEMMAIVMPPIWNLHILLGKISIT